MTFGKCFKQGEKVRGPKNDENGLRVRPKHVTSKRAEPKKAKIQYGVKPDIFKITVLAKENGQRLSSEAGSSSCRCTTTKIGAGKALLNKTRPVFHTKPKTLSQVIGHFSRLVMRTGDMGA